MPNDLPQTISYPLPSTDKLPPPSVQWTPDPNRSALLIHDMQRHFIRPFGECEPVTAVIANIVRLADLARKLSIPIFYTAQPAHQQPTDRALLTDFWGPGIGANDDGARIIDELEPAPGDTVVTKWRYSAFQRSNFAETLVQAGRDQLIITGVYAHIGCQVSAADAFMNDIQPFMIADAVADFSATHHQQALEWVAGRCGVVTDTTSLLAAWCQALNNGSDERSVRDISELIRGKVAELMYMDAGEIGDHENLLDLGLDSIRIMDLVETLRGEGLEASFELLASSSTVHEWSQALKPLTPELHSPKLQSPELHGAGVGA